MAFPVWRRKKQVTVYYYDVERRRQVPLPRKQTKHLDGKSAEAVQAWIEDWERDHGKLRDRVERTNLKDYDKLALLWRQYQAHRGKVRSRRAQTALDETEIFETLICPFFVGKHAKKDPADWHHLISDFHDWLFESGHADATVQKTLWTFERFGKYLVFKQHMTFPFVIQVPARGNNKVTPLKARKTPEQILSFVKDATYKGKIDFNLAILIGYFAALSPSELFALEKSDFVTGAITEQTCKTLPGFRKHGLGSRLAVNITKTLLGKGQVGTVPFTKNDYRRSVVNVWSLAAAKLIAEKVRALPDGRLFPYSRGWLERAWRERVKTKLGVTPHDLRRTSCLYLGRTLRIEPTLLQEHMRHAELDTTMLYMREPSVPELTVLGAQDFDDVA